MKMPKISQAVLFVAGLLLCSAPAAYAVDGVVLIDQARALAGNVTPGDAPGFPVTITRPGSYKLSGNLTAPQDSDGIVIAADDVSLDFNGFTLTASGPGSGRFGIFDGFAAHTRLSIRNGAITSFAGDVFVFDITSVDLRDMRIQNDGPQSNVVLAGTGSILINNIIEGGNFGLVAGVNSVISGNVVRGAKTVGITAFCPSTVTGNTVESNDRGLDFAGDRTRCAIVNNSVLSSTGGN
jgi:hypothetical protein